MCSVETIVRAICKRVLVVFREVVGDAGEPRVHVGAAQLLGGHFLAGRGLHERRAAEKDRARALDDDRLVGHRGHVRAAGRAGAHDDGDLRDALGGHPRLIEEDAPEVLAIRKDLGLQRQKRAAGVDQIDARQPVLERDLLRAHVLLDGDGKYVPPLTVASLATIITSRPDTRPMPVTMPAAGASLSYRSQAASARQLEERRVGVEQLRDALAHRQFALLPVALDVLRRRRPRARAPCARAAPRRARASGRDWPRTPADRF